jgi:uncharacterized delta-60 repeat protein
VSLAAAPSSPTVTATSTVFNGGDYAYGAGIQAVGKIVVAGTTRQSSSSGMFAVARYNPDLSLDTSFGTGGKQTTALTPRVASYGFSMAIDANAGANLGKIVVAGTTYSTSYKGSQYTDFAVARYTTAGVLDTSFGGGKGFVTTNTSSAQTGNDEVFSVTIDGQDRIIAAGTASNGSYQVVTLARYTSSGALDTSFNHVGRQPGVVTLDLGQNAEASGVLVDANGNYLIVGSLKGAFYPPLTESPAGSNGVFVARFTPAGALDPTFGTNGVVSFASMTGNGDLDEFRALTLDASGNIVVVGDAQPAIPGNIQANVVARFTPTGALDTTFGGGKGWIEVQGLERGDSVAIQPDGAIVEGGYADDGTGNYGFAVQRFLSDGSIDTSFNGTGILIYVFPSPNNVQPARGLALGSSGNIVLAGWHDTTTSAPVWGVLNIQP